MTIENIPDGYVLLARKIRKSALWKSLKATHRVVLIDLLLQAQFKDGEVIRNGEIIPLKRGQIATSYQQIVDDIADKDVTVKVVRNAINKLVKHDFLAKDESVSRAKKGLLLTIVNYGIYQESDNYKGKERGKDMGNEGAKQGQSKGKAGAINKNDNNVEECNNNDKKKSRHKFEIRDMTLAELLLTKIRENNPNYKQPNLEKWANDVRLMRERDERTEKQIEYLINWSQDNDFWQSNILSTAKLREKFDTLIMQAKREKQKTNVVPMNRESEYDDYNYGF
ncbi:hypothetical protein KK120_08895 [Virgibacillus dakarensis]|nr:hypothetical protein [Virgibacillus dakarensis]MBT2215939.1 hypothetical protein [Virgibacillus dakarensis]